MQQGLVWKVYTGCSDRKIFQRWQHRSDSEDLSQNWFPSAEIISILQKIMDTIVPLACMSAQMRGFMGCVLSRCEKQHCCRRSLAD